MKNILKIFTALLFALNVMPVSAATQQDMQKDIDALTAAFDAQKAEKDLKEECKKINEEYKALQMSTCSGTVTACDKVEKEKSEKMLTEKASIIKCNVATGRITKKATK